MYTIVQVRKNSNHVIFEYCTEDSGWLLKPECLNLAEQGQLDVELCTSRLGNAYLRARPSSSFQKNLSTLIEKRSKG